jgi:lipoprotein-releasing system ATP-binding protein
LANAPVLILADEPTGNLDEATAARVLDEFLSVVRGHRSAALIATHNSELARRVDRIVELHDGQLAERR